MKKRVKILFISILCCILSFGVSVKTASAQTPIISTTPKEFCLRASFYTTYYSSKEERKHNIKLASSSINDYFLDVGEEFSFNRTVGKRTEKRGYKKAVIILNGRYAEGVGGGVCQVSTTLYNAVLLSGLKVTEWHAHSLPVGYVAPSFDAMVNSGSADLRFVNNTSLPIVIKSSADDGVLKIEIYGERTRIKYIRKSVVLEEISPPEDQVIEDYLNEFPELLKGEQKVISYGKKGIKSNGYLIKQIGGKEVSVKLIRKDIYQPQAGKIVIGTADPPEELVIE